MPHFHMCNAHWRQSRGDAGDTSPPIFWSGGTSMRISPNIITYLKFITSEFTKIPGMPFRDHKTKNFCGGVLPHPQRAQTPPSLELRPPNPELALTPLVMRMLAQYFETHTRPILTQVDMRRAPAAPTGNHRSGPRSKWPSTWNLRSTTGASWSLCGWDITTSSKCF